MKQFGKTEWWLVSHDRCLEFSKSGCVPHGIVESLQLIGQHLDCMGGLPLDVKI